MTDIDAEHQDLLSVLSTKEADIEGLAREALDDRELISQLMQALTSSEERIGYNSLRVLLFVSEERPDLLYPQWDFFVDLLGGDNTYFKLRGAHLITSLTRVDSENKFDKIFDRYYSLLDDRSVVAATQIAANSGKIARAKPALQNRITDRLLSIDTTHHNQERRDRIKGYVIDSLGEYFEQVEDKQRILAFVEEQLESKSPSTAKKAKGFLKRWAN